MHIQNHMTVEIDNLEYTFSKCCGKNLDIHNTFDYPSTPWLYLPHSLPNFHKTGEVDFIISI